MIDKSHELGYFSKSQATDWQKSWNNTDLQNTLKTLIDNRSCATINKIWFDLDIKVTCSSGWATVYTYISFVNSDSDGNSSSKRTLVGEISSFRTDKNPDQGVNSFELTKYFNTTYPFAANSNTGGYSKLCVYFDTSSIWEKKYEIQSAKLRVQYKDEHTITVDLTPKDIGTVSGGGTFDHGTTKTLTATPKAGYKFVKWSDEDTSATRNITVTANTTYTAYFEPVYISYDSIFSFKHWRDRGIGEGSGVGISNLTDTGFTGTAKVSDAYTSECRPVIPVEKGKTYTFECDTSGGSFEFFIFNCNSSGSWSNYTYGNTKKFNFTASTDYISIRCDVVGTGTVVNFNNFRIYPAEYTYMSNSLPAAERTDIISWSIPTPTRKGYTYKGWNTKPNGGGSAYTSSSTFPSNDLILYSQWNANTYQVKYNGNGATYGSMSNSSHTYGTASKLTLNQFRREYTVSYDANGGNCSTSYNVATYGFKEWNTSSDGKGTPYGEQASISTLVDSGTKELFAQWNSDSVTLPTPTRVGYTFDGWYTSAGIEIGDAGKPYTPTANITLYAHWTPNTIKINFNRNGGSGGTSNIWYKYDRNIYYSDSGCTKQISAIEKPTKTGYTFVHYEGDGTSGGIDHERYVEYIGNNGELIHFAPDLCTDIYKDATLTAQWTANSYTIIFNANGGSGSMSNLSMTYDKSQTLPNIGFSRVGYTFLGWSKDKNAIEKTYDNQQSVQNLATNGEVTLYAIWKQNFYTITWANAINGENIIQNNVGGGTDPVYPHGTPIKAPDANVNGYHYHFSGYDKDLEKVGRNITYTAQFTSEKHDFTKIPIKTTEPGKDGNGVDYQGYDTHYCNNCEWTYNDNYVWRVIFNHENGYSLTNEKVPNGTPIFPPSDYQITDYDDAQYDCEFGGWQKRSGDDGINDSTNDIQIWKEGARALGNLIYEAFYSSIVKKYTIRWYNWDGELIRSDYLEYNKEKLPIPPENPTKVPTADKIFVFTGWKLVGMDENKLFPVTGDASYQAQFIEKTRHYTVKWMNPGVDIPLEIDENVQYLDLPDYNGPTPIHPDDATDKKYDYEFIGWSVEVKEPFDENWTGGDYPQDDDLPPVIADIIYTAVYKKTITQYQIKAYVLLGDTTDYCVYYDELEYQEPITIDAWYFGQSIGYDFVKWEDGSTDIQRNIVVEDNAEYRAIYKKKEFNVTWLDYNGRLIHTEKFQYKTIPTIDASKIPTREYYGEYHYVFNNWKLTSGKTTENGAIIGEVTYTATYNRVKHKWLDTKYEFSDNGWYCTASRDCNVEDGNEHHQEVTIKTIPTIRQGNEPTCTEMGYTTYIAIFKDSWNKQIDPITKTVQDIPAKGHDLSLAQTIGKDSVNGCHYRYCRVCTYVEISHHDWNSGIATTESSCFKGGKKRYNCKTPGCTAKHYEKIERIGYHQFGNTIPEVVPTCTEKGYREHKRCQVCGLYFEITDDIYATGRPNKNSFIIEPLGHKYTEEVESTLVKANCYHDGSVEMLCANGCGTSQTMRIPRRQHNWDTGSITTQPTCATGGEGIKTYKCQNKENKYYEKCNGIKTETIPRLPHTIEITKGEAPTCIFKGRADKIWCSVCNEVLQKDYELPPLGHHYVSRFLVPQENTLRREVEFTCDRKDCNHSYTLGFSD